MPKKKGDPKTGGRKKGSLNKVKKKTKEIILDIVEGMQDQIIKDLAELEPKDRVAVWCKLAEFIEPKPQRVDVSFNKPTNKTIEDKLIEMSQDNE